MATDTTPSTKQPDTAARPSTPTPGGTLADLLTSLGNGIIITGLVLAADEAKVFEGTSKGGRPYKFANREIQVWTGNKAVVCKFRSDSIAELPGVVIGIPASFRVVSGRMVGNEMQFEIQPIAA